MKAGTINDGRETMWDIWCRYKMNNPDHCGPIGEFIDNSVSWGNATEIIIFFKQNKIIICDNGTFDRNRFPDTFSMGADKYKEYYNPENTKQIGKYNMGASESTMILGEKGICMHRFSNEGVRVTKLDKDITVVTNRISRNDEQANEDELRMFNMHMDNLETSCDEGTMMTIENTNNITNEYIERIYKFMLGLYPLRTDLKIIMYNMTKCNPTSFDVAIKKEIKPNNLRFGSEPDTCYMNVIKNNGNVKYIRTLTDDYEDDNLSYKIKVQYCILSKKSQCDEKNEFGNTTDEEMVGFRFFRGERLISGPKPLRFGFSTGMNRGKGVRLYVYLPANNETVDKDFKIGTQKKMTEGHYQNFDPKLCNWLEEMFGHVLKQIDRIIKDRSSKYTHDTNGKITEIKKNEKTIQYIELTDIRSAIKSEYLTISNKTHECIVKKNGKSYDALVKYDNEVNRIISEISAEIAKECQNVIDKIIEDVLTHAEKEIEEENEIEEEKEKEKEKEPENEKEEKKEEKKEEENVFAEKEVEEAKDAEEEKEPENEKEEEKEEKKEEEEEKEEDGEEEKCEDTFTENDSFVETGGVSGRRIIDALDNGRMYTIDDITQLFNNLNKLT